MSSKKLNWKLIIFGVVLLTAGIISFFYKENIKGFFNGIFTNVLTDWIIVVLIVVILIMHSINNKGEDNTVSDKEGLYSFIDYINFGARVLSLLYCIKILTLLYFYPQELGCGSLGRVNFIILLTIFIISFYLINTVKPIASEAVRGKAKIELD